MAVSDPLWTVASRVFGQLDSPRCRTMSAAEERPPAPGWSTARPARGGRSQARVSDFTARCSDERPEAALRPWFHRRNERTVEDPEEDDPAGGEVALSVTTLQSGKGDLRRLGVECAGGDVKGLHETAVAGTLECSVVSDPSDAPPNSKLVVNPERETAAENRRRVFIMRPDLVLGRVGPAK